MNKPTSKKTVALDSDQKADWTLYFGVQDKNAPQNPDELAKSDFKKINATVPGNVEIDLQKAGIIENPEKGDNVWHLRKYETYQWWYQRSFRKPELKDGERVELCFDGIDCIADIWLNDKKIARVENMFVEHHFDVTDLLKSDNEIAVCIYSTLLEARKHLRNNFGVRYDALAEAVSIRKAAHSFGWDILPRLMSAGIWKDVKLEIIPADYWESVYWVTKSVNVENKTADVYVDWQFNTDRLNVDDLTLKISLSRNNKIAYEKSIKIYTTVSRERISGLKDVDFWWTRGLGEPALYEAKLQLIDSTGKVLCENVQYMGIRKIDLVVTPINTKENPGEFVFKVNGERVFVKGTNWVALDALHSRDIQHLDTAMNMLVDLNCNMVRLWGDDQINIDPNTDVISRQVLPLAVREWDPKTPYLPSSPFISSEVFNVEKKINSNLSPEMHLWGPRGFYKAPFYTENMAKFVSEIGYHGCPNLKSPEKMMDKDFVYPWTNADKTSGKFITGNEITSLIWNEQWQCKATMTHLNSEVNSQRNHLMTNQINCVFGEVPADLNQFITASQIVQAEAMKYFVEFWRMNKTDRNGILWWNLRDGWPIISDAVVDYYGSKKLAYRYIKRVQTDVCVMIGDASDNKHPVVVVNDTRKIISISVTIKDSETQKKIFSKSSIIPKNGKLRIGFIPETNAIKMWIIEWNVNGRKFFNHYLAYNPPIQLDEYMKWLTLLNKE